MNAEVAERQTRYVQGVVSARACEFKSHLRHQSTAPVAQWIARLVADQKVGGSSPPGRTSK